MKAKTYTASYVRHNPQLGDYPTKRTFEARTEKAAWRKAREYAVCLYGSMTLVDLRPAEDVAR